MKKFFLFIILVAFPLLAMAQASGGQITRKTRNDKSHRIRQQHQEKRQPSNSVKLENGTILIYETTKEVDLGLPSGTIWAGWNVGADNPLEYGNYYAWGETYEKTWYDWDTYRDTRSFSKEIVGTSTYDVVNFTNYKVHGKTSIIGTQDDVAYAIWGKEWQMPTMKQLEELINECKISTTAIDGKNYVIFTGPNGKSMIFPVAGEKYKNETRTINRELVWSGELCQSCPYSGTLSQESYFAYYLCIFEVGAQGLRCHGMNVRAVRSR